MPFQSFGREVGRQDKDDNSESFLKDSIMIQITPAKHERLKFQAFYTYYTLLLSVAERP